MLFSKVVLKINQPQLKQRQKHEQCQFSKFSLESKFIAFTTPVKQWGDGAITKYIMNVN